MSWPHMKQWHLVAGQCRYPRDVCTRAIYKFTTFHYLYEVEISRLKKRLETSTRIKNLDGMHVCKYVRMYE